jgi:repressor LexA
MVLYLNMMIRLSEEAKQIYNVIRNGIKENGKAPTIQEIVKERNLSTRKVLDSLRELEDSLIIKRSPYKSRAIEIISSLTEEGKPKEEIKRIQILGTAPGGPFLYAAENIEDGIDIPIRLLKGNKDVYLLRVVGNSMSPFLDDGDLALVKKQDYANKKDVVVAVTQNISGEYEATIKEYNKYNNQVILSPINTSHDYSPIVGSAQDIGIQGIVIGAIKLFQN